jgi:hypothetical protein
VSMRVTIARDPPPPEAPPGSPTAKEWDRQRAANPRLFNGPVLSVVSLDPAAAHIAARRDTYQRLVVQPRVHTGVRMLAVTGVGGGDDAAGRRHALFGLRGPGVRVYPGMWELGPSGGLPVPPAPVAELSPADLARALADEIDEEIGVEVPAGTPCAMVRDHAAFSDDICVLIDAGALEPLAERTAPANWEYQRTAWVPLDALPDWERSHADSTIAATRALLRLLAWVP